MEWISYPENKPTESGTYIVSITRPYESGDLTFKYIAYYKPDLNSWFQYDPFTDKISDKITFKVNGWVEKFAIYLG